MTVCVHPCLEAKHRVGSVAAQVQWAGLMCLLSSHSPNEHYLSDPEQGYRKVCPDPYRAS